MLRQDSIYFKKEENVLMNKMKNFKKKITNYKEELFTLRLFYEQAEILWPPSLLNWNWGQASQLHKM